MATAGAIGRAQGGARTDPLAVGQRHTLLITVDRLSPLPTALGVYHRPNEPVPVSQQLHLLTLERLGLTEQTWHTFATLLTQTAQTRVALPGTQVLAGIDAAELVELPGVQDFLALRRIRDEAVSGQWQRIVVDLSGCGDPFTFLRAPAVLRQALTRLWPRHQRLAAAADRPILGQLTTAVEAIDRDCADVAELLTDAHGVAAHLVVAADERAARVVDNHLAAADLCGLPVRTVVVNEGVGVAARAEQAIDAVTAVAGDGVEVRSLPALGEPLDRSARFRRLGVALHIPNGRTRGVVAAEVSHISGSGVSAVYELSWEQRLPEPDRLKLGRSGDDLLVTVSGLRCPVTLPSVLRRCQVIDARWDGRRLVVAFAPDPAVWPQR